MAPEESSEKLKKHFSEISPGKVVAKMVHIKKDENAPEKSLAHRPVTMADASQLSLYSQMSAPLSLDAYLASALTGEDEPQRNERLKVSDLLADICGKHNISLYRPGDHTDPIMHAHIEDFSVRRIDRTKVLQSDLLILLSHLPSFGAGEELEFAFNALMPMIIISPAGTRLSRMVTGIPAFQMHIQYKDHDELKRDFQDAIIKTRPFLEERKMAFTDYDMNIVGEKIRVARERLNLTREEVAQKSYLKEAALRDLEESTDSVSNPSLITLRQIAAVLRTTVADLVEPDLEERLLALLHEWVGNQAAARFRISQRDRNRILRTILYRVLDSLDREA